MWQKEISLGGLLDADQRSPVTVAEMKAIEDAGEQMGISKGLMMENAGSCIAQFIFQNRHYFNRNDNSSKLHVVFVAGTGNNGGDAFVAARHLTYWRDLFEVSMAIVGNRQEIHAEEAKCNLEILEKISRVEIIQVDSENRIAIFAESLNNADLLIIGLFGTGFKGEPRPLQAQIIRLINANAVLKKISVDIPSGLEAESGSFKIAVKSDFTITMHAAKVGMLKNQTANNQCGRILVANIGVPA